jgi:hypothetical protein
MDDELAVCINLPAENLEPGGGFAAAVSCRAPDNGIHRLLVRTALCIATRAILGHFF